MGVPVNNPGFTDINDIQDVPPTFLEEIEQFFREHKNLEGKTTQILGWKTRDKALKAIKHSIELYNEMLSLKTLFL